VVDTVPKVDRAQPFAINNTMVHLYRCGNDALFSSISFQFQRRNFSKLRELSLSRSRGFPTPCAVKVPRVPGDFLGTGLQILFARLVSVDDLSDGEMSWK
jgi:hypothetical protein